MAKAAKKLDDLFHDTLKDIYFAEKKILSALPKMAKAAQDDQLQAAFEMFRRLLAEGHEDAAQKRAHDEISRPHGIDRTI